MPIDFDPYDEIVGRIRADIANLLPDVDPTISGSFVNALSVANAGRHYDNVILLMQILKELFPQTATGEYLELWAQYDGLSRINAIPSNGYITLTGTLATSVPALTEWRTVNNILVSSTLPATIALASYSISSLTRSGTTVTGTTATDHTFSSGMEIDVAGAVETDYNGTWTITVLSETTFSFEITTTPTTPATGTITGSYTGASVLVEAVDAGIDGNLVSGTQLQVTTPIVGLDSDAFVQYLGLTGGGDVESDDDLRSRLLFSRANPVANFNESAIKLAALTVPGVTRVFVNRITPYVGAVTVAFMRDNDADPIPDAGEVQDVRDVLLAILPAQSDPNDLIVQAPSPVTVDFTFTLISPDTATMRDAITNRLIAFFDDELDYEADVDEDKYRAVIIDTYDSETGDSLQNFTLSSPVGDVSISTGEIGVLGDVDFP